MPTTVTPDQVEATIVDAIGKLGFETDGVSRSSTLEELDIDSLDLVEIAQILEEEHGVEIKGEEAKGLQTVGDVVDLVVAKSLSRDELGLGAAE